MYLYCKPLILLSVDLKAWNQHELHPYEETSIEADSRRDNPPLQREAATSGPICSRQ